MTTAKPPTASTLSVAAVVSVVLGAFFLLGLVLFRVINPVLSLARNIPGSVITALGAFGLATIVLVAVVVIFAHAGFAATRPGGKRGRALAVVGLTLGYTLVVIYISTLVAAAIATAHANSGTFVQNMFSWV